MADYGSGTMGTIDHILGSRDEVFKPGPTADQDKIGNQEYYFQINENTNKVEVKRKWNSIGGQIVDTTVGHYDKDGNYTCKGGSSGGHHQSECDYFSSKEGSQATLKQAKIVATKTEPNSIPPFDKMAGFTTMIYAIVKNVANPAKSSVLILLPLIDI